MLINVFIKYNEETSLVKIEILKNINIDLAIGGGFNIVRVNKKEER